MSETPEPLVSICISAYDVERYLRETLVSVLGQSYQNLEVILLDNGSTDATYNVARSFSDPRLRLLRIESNIGGYEGMNKTIRQARGEFIAVYHSDDIYEPTIVEKEVAYLRSHPASGAVFSMDHFIDEDGRIYGGNSLPHDLQKESLTYEDLFPDMVRNKNIRICCPTFMARRTTLESVGLFNPQKYGIGADLEMWIRILRRCPIGILNERLMRYRHSKSQWSSRYNHVRTEAEICFPIMDEFLEKDDWRKELKPADLIEYEFHRCDDNTVRAVNQLIRGEGDIALELLRQRPYPWGALIVNIRRRKLRVLLMRAFIRFGLAIGAVHSMRRILVQSEYGGHI